MICVASAGNQGQMTLFYPAAWSNFIGVASTTNVDQRSSFSNCGENLVTAQRERVITMWPSAPGAAGRGYFVQRAVYIGDRCAADELSRSGHNSDAAGWMYFVRLTAARIIQ